MTEIHWTSEQKAAIETIAGDLLVTAAAGAGKTAVLTHRCIHLVTRIDPPCHIDELLVLTYTEAAAAEMKRRIRSALYEQTIDQPHNAHLHRQLALLDQARISTIHSFCNTLLREYFYRLSLDPGFEVLDADEADLLKLQIAEELLEDYYDRSQEADSSDEFARFVRSYSTGTGDRQLIDLLIRLHNFLETLSDHSAWTTHARQILQTPDPNDPNTLFVVQRQKDLLKRQLKNLIRRLELAHTEIERDPALELYARYIEQDVFPVLNEIHNALAADDLNHALDILTQNKTLKRVPNKPRDLTPEHAEVAKNRIDRAKDVYKTLYRKFAIPPENVVRQLHAVTPSIHLLLEIQGNFLRRYNDAKRRQNVLDFADLEHLALKLLQEKDQPSNVARQIRDRFRFILVDEYQDISPIQEALLRTISRNHSSGSTASNDQPNVSGNLFMVGDVKQSIYSFRQADPTIFLAKLNQFAPYPPRTDTSPTEIPCQVRIDLNKNFRARRHLINATNYIFSRCMPPEFVDFDYQKEAQLIYGAECYDQRTLNDGPRTPAAVELHLIERDIEEAESQNDTTDDAGHTDDRIERDAARREAAIVARRIRQMVGVDHPEGQAEFDIVDPDNGQQRPVTYRDVVVLLRSMKMHADTWSEVFHQLGVPVHAERTGGFFVATEIQDMISLLQLLENPLQDIPLASVLRSPIVQLNESQLAAIRLYTPKLYYDQAVFRYAHSGPDDTIQKTLTTFLEQLDQWRTFARRQPLAQLLWKIYRDTNLLASVSSLPQGRQRYRNLLHLHDRARQFDSFANQGLARFLAFIEKLRAEEGDFGPAPVLSQGDNVVRIMSVHKSKGLEFPVVILADLARRFNTRDLKSDIIYNQYPNTTVGIRLATPASDRYPTLTHHLAAADKQRALLAEELRILYVAMTRAREHLLLIAGARLDKSRKQWQLGLYATDMHRADMSIPSLPEFVLSSAQSPIDWLGPAMAGHPDFRGVLAEPGSSTGGNVSGTGAYPLDARFQVTVYDAAEVARQVSGVLREQDSCGGLKEVQEWIDVDGESVLDEMDPEARGLIERLEWRYPQAGLTQLGARASVTELKRQMAPDSDPDFFSERDVPSDPYGMEPAFFRDRSVQMDAKEIGSCTHLFLQHLELDRELDTDGLELQLSAMVDRGVFSKSQREVIDIQGVARFFASEPGQKMLANRITVQREWPFTLAMPVQDVYPNVTLDQEEKKEMVLIRGIIDCLFESKEGVWIIDFKTDTVSEADCRERAESYRAQMQLYRRSVERILDTKVAVSMLYFLKPSVGIEIY